MGASSSSFVVLPVAEVAATLLPIRQQYSRSERTESIADAADDRISAWTMRLLICQKPQNHRDFHLSQLLGGREGFPSGNKANDPNEDGPNDLFERYELR